MNMRKSYMYMLITTALFVISVWFAHTFMNRGIFYKALPSASMFTFIFLILYGFGILWCIGMKWEEDKVINKKKR